MLTMYNMLISHKKHNKILLFWCRIFKFSELLCPCNFLLTIINQYRKINQGYKTNCCKRMLKGAILEKPNLLIKDSKLAQKVAKGTIYCWTAIINADGEYKEEEFHEMTSLAEKNDYVKQFYNKDSLKKVFLEGLDILKNYGLDDLLNRVKFTFREIDKNIRGHVFYACLHLACIDRNIANKEIVVLQKIYRTLNLDIDSVFRLSLLFFQSEFAKQKTE